MAEVVSFRTHLVKELADLLDAEDQITEALPKLAKAATCTSQPVRALDAMLVPNGAYHQFDSVSSPISYYALKVY